MPKDFIFPGVSVVHFKAASDLQCKQISPFVDMLCARYPSINFVKASYRHFHRITLIILCMPRYFCCCILDIKLYTYDGDALQVDIEETPAVANIENVKIVPTFKIYKHGSRVKEMVCPCREMLEHSVRHYSF